jgi:hypothetical protein
VTFSNMARQFYITKDLLEGNRGTKFSFVGFDFYIYEDTRRKNLDILYVRSLQSMMRIIFLQYLGYCIEIPKTMTIDEMFVTQQHVYKPNSAGFKVYFDGERLSTWDSVVDQPQGKLLRKRIQRLGPDIASKFDYALFEEYLKLRHKITDINVLATFIHAEWKRHQQIILEVGLERAEFYFEPEHEDYCNCFLIYNHLAQNG